MFFKGNTNLIVLKAEVRSQNLLKRGWGLQEEQWLLRLTIHCAGGIWMHLSFSGFVRIESLGG